MAPRIAFPRCGEWMVNIVELEPLFREPRHAVPACHGRSGQYLMHAGSTPQHLYRIDRGWAVQFRFLPDGRRHIIDYYVTGDWCDVAWLSGGQAAGAVRAVTDYSATAFCMRQARQQVGSHLHVAAQYQLLLSRKLQLQTERALGLGRKTATERLAHLLCEIVARLDAAGLVEDGQCFMPLTQTDLADLAGLTPIHVNRVLQQLRSAEMISLSGKRLALTGPERLQRLAMFNPGYLDEPSGFELSVS